MEGNNYLGTTARGLTKDVEISTPWGKIATKTFGNSADIPVLCIHGWMDSANSFDGLLPHLPKDFFFVFMDLPGHGLSSHIPLGFEYTHNVYVMCIARVVKYFNWTRFNIIAHSMGGDIATMFAATFPEMVDKIVLLDASGGWLYAKQAEPVTLFRRNTEGIIKHENTQSKPTPKLTYEEAKKGTIFTGKMTEETADILLERGLKKHEDGLYSFRADSRLKLWLHTWDNVTSSDKTKKFLANVKADVLYILANKGVVMKYLGIEEIKKIQTEVLSQAQMHGIEMVDGGHHAHVCNAETVANHFVPFLCTNTAKKL